MNLFYLLLLNLSTVYDRTVQFLSSRLDGKLLVTVYYCCYFIILIPGLVVVGKSGRLCRQDGDPDNFDGVDPEQTVLHRNEPICYNMGCFEKKKIILVVRIRCGCKYEAF